jgi:hypothetical protein
METAAVADLAPGRRLTFHTLFHHFHHQTPRLLEFTSLSTRRPIFITEARSLYVKTSET